VEQQILDQLVQILNLIASDFQTQVDSVPDFVVVTDEMASIYCRDFLGTQHFIEKDIVSENQFKMLEELDCIFKEMKESNDAKLWTLDSLKENPVWDNIRKKALKILESFGKKLDKPDLEWLC